MSVQIRTSKRRSKTTGKRIKFPTGRGTRIQSYRFKKGDRFKSKTDVRNWLKRNQVRGTIKLTKKDSEFSARQIPPSKIEIVGRTDISRDVDALVGFPVK